MYVIKYSRFLFSEENNTLSRRAFSGIQVIPYIKFAYHYIAVGVKRHMSPKRILNVELSYLPNCTEIFFIGFRKKEPVSNLRLK